MTIKIGNYQFHYSLKGSNNQPAILFLHGFMGNSQDFDAAISLLSQNFYCLAFDLPGHGKTRVIGGEDCYTIPQTAQALITLLDELEIDKCLLFGYSMGGRLALYMSLYFSSRFDKVILESASPGLRHKSEREQRLQADLHLAQKLKTSDFKDFLLNWYNQPLFKSLKDRPDFEQLIERKLDNNPIELAKSLRNMGIGNQPSLWEELENNQIPMLLLTGEYDDKFIAINTEMASLCPKAKLEVIPKTGHNIHLENLNKFVTILMKFYCSVES
ncbi:2-succinyl-6-hydroxy-2,4-cyclohexadiene-1-carboxylate synthase [Kamptonema animale CS-326]|jgi:2-succinyl-6-hydroxy-2,4-cyclohexadiene-1-carboxylate synthase|uniref:2-succinyl-6-hydroxy-2, 4-cyclohexadiene-1-carboxylate synthase n=1 Tax=Kamptonema animale TaxID=92934 RepID=UPI002330AFAE|nr:2-succinyl-6-hydroxy-2,4-cyclohexadiene-1-carboxylate synthase [Kamptonema animale]MDB9509628.1 2-succinyl-6-hydroxy-2,4-cyclohexadiene-1-carboxylate synthase [Kamptonema animale CS-326]